MNAYPFERALLLAGPIHEDHSVDSYEADGRPLRYLSTLDPARPGIGQLRAPAVALLEPELLLGRHLFEIRWPLPLRLVRVLDRIKGLRRVRRRAA